MQNLQEKLKEILLLSDEDVDLFLNGDLKMLLARNKEACIRLGIVYGICLVIVLLFLSLFAVFGAFFKVILSFLFFGALGGAVFLAGIDNVRKMMKYPVFSYYLTGLAGLVALRFFSDIWSQGSFLSACLLLMITAGIAAGAYTLRAKAAEKGFSGIYLIAGGLLSLSFLLSLQAAAVQFGVDMEVAQAQEMSEIRRAREAERMRMSVASSKACATEEECRKMNTKKNSYYAEHEENAQDACERAVAKEIAGRFEWTVSARDYKFTSYQVDVPEDDILLMGDRAQLISNDGIKTKISYSCHYNTKKKTAIASINSK